MAQCSYGELDHRPTAVPEGAPDVVRAIFDLVKQFAELAVAGYSQVLASWTAKEPVDGPLEQVAVAARPCLAGKQVCREAAAWSEPFSASSSTETRLRRHDASRHAPQY